MIGNRLTPRRRAILRALHAASLSGARSLTLAALATRIGLASPHHLGTHLLWLQRHGFLLWGQGPREISLTPAALAVLEEKEPRP